MGWKGVNVALQVKFQKTLFVRRYPTSTDDFSLAAVFSGSLTLVLSAIQSRATDVCATIRPGGPLASDVASIVRKQGDNYEDGENHTGWIEKPCC